MNFLAVCAVVKNEARYIVEWIEYHRLVCGVKHFYLYDNGSSDLLAETLINYVQDDVVTYIKDRDNPIQFKAYNDCLKRFGCECDWIAFLDCDEFLYPVAAYDKPLFMRQFLENLPFNAGALAVHWNLFGTSGRILYEDIPVVERFKLRAKDTNPHVKSIVKTAGVSMVGANPHYFILKKGYLAYDENLKVLPENYALDAAGTSEILAIRHYHTKSKTEYVSRKRNGDPGLGFVRSPEWVAESLKAHDVNEVTDTLPEPILEALKNRIEARLKVIDG